MELSSTGDLLGGAVHGPLLPASWSPTGPSAEAMFEETGGLQTPSLMELSVDERHIDGQLTISSVIFPIPGIE